MGTSMDMSPADNVNLIYFMENYLVQFVDDSFFNGVYSNIVCPLNIQICELILNYRIIERYPANRFVDKNNNRPFENAHDENVQYLLVYERKKK